MNTTTLSLALRTKRDMMINLIESSGNSDTLKNALLLELINVKDRIKSLEFEQELAAGKVELNRLAQDRRDHFAQWISNELPD